MPVFKSVDPLIYCPLSHINSSIAEAYDRPMDLENHMVPNRGTRLAPQIRLLIGTEARHSAVDPRVADCKSGTPLPMGLAPAQPPYRTRAPAEPAIQTLGTARATPRGFRTISTDKLRKA